jgi:dolichol-phosphate mannosyltransferase
MKKELLTSINLHTYNEAESADKLISNLLSLIKKRWLNVEILVVDDNSPDETASLLKKKFKNNEKVKVFIRKKDRGLGTAIAYGIKQARGSIIIGMDADGNHPVKQIPLLLKELKNYDLVVASRFVRGGGVKKITERWRHWGSFIFNAIFKLLLGSPVWDSTSGFYAIYKDKLVNLGLQKIYYGFGDYHLRLVYFAKKNGYRTKEIPCIYEPRLGGVSKSKLFKMFFDYLGEAIRLRFQ